MAQPAGGLAGQLAVERRLAGGQDVAAARDDGLLREAVLARQLGDRAPDQRLDAPVVEGGEGLVDPYEAQIAIGAVENTVSSRVSDRSARSCRRALSIASAQRWASAAANARSDSA